MIVSNLFGVLQSVSELLKAFIENGEWTQQGLSLPFGNNFDPIILEAL